MLEKIKNIINIWDPIDLFPHSPDDEYEDEIAEIHHIIFDGVTAEELGIKIQNIFISSFDKDIFNKSPEECVLVAKKILNT